MMIKDTKIGTKFEPRQKQLELPLKPDVIKLTTDLDIDSKIVTTLSLAEKIEYIAFKNHRLNISGTFTECL